MTTVEDYRQSILTFLSELTSERVAELDALSRDAVHATLRRVDDDLGELDAMLEDHEDGSSSLVFLAAVLPLFAVVTYALATLAGSLAVVA